MGEQITECPYPVDDGFHTIYMALGRLEILSEAIHSGAADNRAFEDVCRDEINGAANEIGRGLKDIARAYPELKDRFGKELGLDPQEDEAEKAGTIEGLKDLSETFSHVAKEMEGATEDEGGRKDFDEAGGYYDSLNEITNKICMLRDSCKAMGKLEDFHPSSTWFSGASEVCDNAAEVLFTILFEGEHNPVTIQRTHIEAPEPTPQSEDSEA